MTLLTYHRRWLTRDELMELFTYDHSLTPQEATAMGMKRYQFKREEVIEVVEDNEEDARVEANAIADLPPLDQSLRLVNVSDA